MFSSGRRAGLRELRGDLALLILGLPITRNRVTLSRRSSSTLSRIMLCEHDTSPSRGIDGHREQLVPSAIVFLVHIKAQIQDEPAGEHGPDN